MTYYSSAAACKECPNCNSEDGTDGGGGGDDGHGDGLSGGCYPDNIVGYPENFTHSINQPAGVNFNQLRYDLDYFFTFDVENVCRGGEIQCGSPGSINVVPNDCSDTVGVQFIDNENPAVDPECHLVTYKERSGGAMVQFKLCRMNTYGKTGNARYSSPCMTLNDEQFAGGPKPVNKFIFGPTFFGQSPWTERDYLNSCDFQTGFADVFNSSTVLYYPYESSSGIGNPNGTAFESCCDNGVGGGSYSGNDPGDFPYCTNAQLRFQWGPPYFPYLGPNGVQTSAGIEYPTVFENASTPAPHVWNKRAKAFFQADMFFKVDRKPDPFDTTPGHGGEVTFEKVRHTVVIVLVGRCTPNNEVDVATEWLFEPKYAWVSRPANGDVNQVTSDGYLWKGPSLEEAGVEASSFRVPIDWEERFDVVI